MVLTDYIEVTFTNSQTALNENWEWLKSDYDNINSWKLINNLANTVKLECSDHLLTGPSFYRHTSHDMFGILSMVPEFKWIFIGSAELFYTLYHSFQPISRKFKISSHQDFKDFRGRLHAVRGKTPPGVVAYLHCNVTKGLTFFLRQITNT